eukprot:COSAG01_NODE_222_length_21420_cov_30.616763_7_plen_125_part_00
MYSVEGVHSRFPGSFVVNDNPDHFFCAFSTNGSWQYTAYDGSSRAFAPNQTDLLVASLNFTGRQTTLGHATSSETVRGNSCKQFGSIPAVADHWPCVSHLAMPCRVNLCASGGGHPVRPGQGRH